MEILPTVRWYCVLEYCVRVLYDTALYGMHTVATVYEYRLAVK